VKVYPAFVEGAKEGFQIAVRVIPPLVAVVVALGSCVPRGHGRAGSPARAIDLGGGNPDERAPMVLVRPLSGGAALGVVADVLRSDGPDSYAGRLVSVMAGIDRDHLLRAGRLLRRHRDHPVPAGAPAALLADLAGFAASVVAVRWLFG